MSPRFFTVSLCAAALGGAGAPQASAVEMAEQFRNPATIAEAQDYLCKDNLALWNPEPRINLNPKDIDGLLNNPGGPVRVRTCIGEFTTRWAYTIMNVAGGNQILFGNPDYPKYALQVYVYGQDKANVSLCYVHDGLYRSRGEDVSLCGRVTSTHGIFSATSNRNIIGNIRGGSRRLGDYQSIFPSDTRNAVLVRRSKQACARVAWGQNMVRLSDYDGQRARRCRARA